MNRTNCNLHSYEKYFQSINNLLISKNLPQSIIFSGEDGLGKKTFLLHFFAFCLLNTLEKKEYLKNFVLKDINILKRLSHNEFSNFKIIERDVKKSFIQIDQIRELISFCSYEASTETPRFILISNIEDLNSSAANSLLKLLEEPPKNTYFFLIRNSHSKIYETILSRCHKINIKIDKKTSSTILNKLLNDFELSDFDSYSHFDPFDTPGSVVKKIIYMEKNKISNLNCTEIVKFFYEDYKKNKNFDALEYGNQLTKKIFFDKYQDNYRKYKKLYSLFEKRSKELISFNSNIDSIYRIIRKLGK